MTQTLHRRSAGESSSTDENPDARPGRPDAGAPGRRFRRGGGQGSRRGRSPEEQTEFGVRRRGRRGFGRGGFEDEGSGARGFGSGGFASAGFGARGFGPGGHGGPGGFGPGGPGGFGPGGFGPGGFGPGGFGPGGFGPGGRGRGPGGFGPGRGRRRGRGNVRAAILALLHEEPRHGYAIMNELAERSGGLWRPSPGSVYPVLQQLQDEGLVTVEESEGRRVFSLTDEGRRLVAESPGEFAEPWAMADAGPRQRVRSLFEGMAALGMATREVARLGDDAQTERARAVLDEARRAMYRILAEETSEGPRSSPSSPRLDTE